MVTVSQQVSDDDMRGLLCSALEGGSNYWYMITKYVFPKGVGYKDFQEGGRFTLEEYWHPYELIPFVDGCALKFGEMGEDMPGEFTLDRAAMEKGIQIMAEKYPEHFADVISEDGDAATGDVFLQCCLFGELIFG